MCELTHAENTSAWVNSRSAIWLEWAKTDRRRAVLIKFGFAIMWAYKTLITISKLLYGPLIFAKKFCDLLSSDSTKLIERYNLIGFFLSNVIIRSTYFRGSAFQEREMIFEHPFGDNFCDNFLSHTHIIFYFISLLLWFPCQYYFFFVNYGCQISCH